MPESIPIRGRGAAQNPANRFEKIGLEKDGENFDPEEPSPRTRFLKSPLRSVITPNDSPDVGFSASFNPYRGCEHGCIYCFSRPTHEYFGLSAGLDFETTIFVKEDAPELLRREFSSPKWKPQVVAMGTVTDVYQPAERRFRLTRRSLEVFAEFLNPVFIITKNFLVTRDIDVLRKLAEAGVVGILVSVTTLDEKIARVMEPRTSHPRARLEAVRLLSDAKIPVGVNVAPVVPGLTDHEMPAILKAAREAGAQYAGYTPVRLPYGVAGLFEDWLSRHFPDRKEKVLNRIRSMRGGKLNDPRFGKRMRGQGIFADQIRELFHVGCHKAGMPQDWPELSTASFRRARSPKEDLFPNS